MEIGTLVILFIISAAFGSAAMLTYRKLRMTPGPNESLFRTGYRGNTITHDVSMWVCPLIQMVTRVSHYTVEIRLDPHEYVTKDRKILTMDIVFEVRVNKDAEAIVQWVRATGGKETGYATTLLEAKLTSTFRLLIAEHKCVDLIGKRHLLMAALSDKIDNSVFSELGLTNTSTEVSNIRDTGKVWTLGGS